MGDVIKFDGARAVMDLSTLPTRYVFIDSQNKWFDTKTKTTISKEALNTTWARHIPKDDGTAASLLSKDEGTQVVNGQGWAPIDEAIFTYGTKTLVNTYEGLAVQPVEGDASEWLELMRHIYREHVDLVLDHLAFSLQKPMEKIRWQILVVGAPRRGKTTTLRPIVKIWGSAANVLTASDVDSQWGNYWFGKKLIVVEEVYQPGNKGFYNNLKNRFANDNMEFLNMKYEGTVLQQNLYEMFLFTNHKESLTFNADDDKLLVIEAPTERWGNPERFRALCDAIDGKEDSQLTGHILHYLLNRDVRQFSSGALPVRTDAMLEMAEAGKADYHKAIVEQAESGQSPFHADVVQLKQVRDWLREEGYARHGDQGVSEAMKDAGYERLRGQKKVAGKVLKTPSLWVQEGHTTLAMRPVELYDWWDKYGRPYDFEPY